MGEKMSEIISTLLTRASGYTYPQWCHSVFCCVRFFWFFFFCFEGQAEEKLIHIKLCLV